MTRPLPDPVHYLPVAAVNILCGVVNAHDIERTMDPSRVTCLACRDKLRRGMSRKGWMEVNRAIRERNPIHYVARPYGSTITLREYEIVCGASNNFATSISDRAERVTCPDCIARMPGPGESEEEWVTRNKARRARKATEEAQSLITAAFNAYPSPQPHRKETP